MSKFNNSSISYAKKTFSLKLTMVQPVRLHNLLWMLYDTWTLNLQHNPVEVMSLKHHHQHRKHAVSVIKKSKQSLFQDINFALSRYIKNIDILLSISISCIVEKIKFFQHIATSITYCDILCQTLKILLPH